MTFPRSCSRSNLSCFVDEDKNRVYTGKEILQKNISKPPISNKAESSRSTLTIFRKKSLKATKEDPSEFPKLRKRESSKPPSGYQYRCRVLFDFDGNDLNSDFYPGSDSAWYQSYSSGINTDLTEVISVYFNSDISAATFTAYHAAYVKYFHSVEERMHSCARR